MQSSDLLLQLKSQLDTLDKYDKDDSNRKAILETVWLIGKEVYFFTRETGRQIAEIAEEVGAPSGTLQKHVRFYKLYPEGYADEFAGQTVAWSHYTAVLYVRNKDARDFYVRTAAAEGWSSHELRRRIRNNFFENRREAVESGSETPATLTEKDQSFFTYSADVIRVIDGDTMKLDIDIGFNIKILHVVRLRGIDCPEKGTEQGDAATAFVEEVFGSVFRGHSSKVVVSPELSNGSAGTEVFRGHSSKVAVSPELSAGTVPAVGGLSQGTPRVVVRTYKAEKFGRYLVDLWYLPGETDREEILNRGKLLNQVLLDTGHAEKVE